jgi:MoaA/NifB/PqqE/SkfB family radical SAM enzyme
MGVDEIACNYLTVYEPEQLQYSCYFCKEKTNEYFEKAREMVKNFNVKLILPPLFGSSEDKQNMCTDPWSFFYVETQGSVNPCCFAGNHIGYINKNEFSNIWNGEEYRRLREGMVSGNIHSWCRHCYRYNRKNVNDIRSHITFRPEAQKKILNYLAENKDKYKITKTEDLFIK